MATVEVKKASRKRKADDAEIPGYDNKDVKRAKLSIDSSEKIENENTIDFKMENNKSSDPFASYQSPNLGFSGFLSSDKSKSSSTELPSKSELMPSKSPSNKNNDQTCDKIKTSTKNNEDNQDKSAKNNADDNPFGAWINNENTDNTNNSDNKNVSSSSLGSGWGSTSSSFGSFGSFESFDDKSKTNNIDNKKEEKEKEFVWGSASNDNDFKFDNSASNFSWKDVASNSNSNQDANNNNNEDEPIACLTGLVDAGDNDDVTIYEIKCKVWEFNKSDNKWHEKGIGMVKLNTYSSGETTKARLLCRKEVTFKTLINAMIQKDTKFSKENIDNIKFTTFEQQKNERKEGKDSDDDLTIVAKTYLMRLKESDKTKIDTFLSKIQEIQEKM